VSLRWRIALGFALVALATAAVVALAAPPIVGQGFAELDNERNGDQASPSPSAPTIAPQDTPTTSPSSAAGATDDSGPSAGARGTTEPGDAWQPGDSGEPDDSNSPFPSRTPRSSSSPSASPTLRPSGSAGASSWPGPSGSDDAVGALDLNATTTFGPAGAAVTSGASSASAEPADQGDGTDGTGATPSSTSQAQQSTILRLILAAAAAAAAASILGLIAAGRLVRPLTKLEEAAGAVARGDLSRRSGLADRRDEFGQLGRTFDSMASELQLSEESRRGFLQDAAHELKTPLAVIDATASAILDGVYKPEKRHIETIRDQSRVLARIVDDLRTISLAEGGHLPLQRRALDVAAILSSVATGFEARAAAAHIRLSVAARPGLAVNADPDRFRQIVTALVDNALRHTPDGGTVTLGADLQPPAARTAARSTVRITVDDTGPGIPADALPRVFERFYQADPSHSRGAGTSGLGLSIVRALVEAHGGHAGAENRADGGARLWFELPVA
jgi:two-component system sensor histidine kinase BaeS